MEFARIPKYAGEWIIGGYFGIRVAVEKRPHWLHRLMARWLLGWEWRDNA